jgi:RNA polymerase sigma factor (sigma-70 family)
MLFSVRKNCHDTSLMMTAAKFENFRGIKLIDWRLTIHEYGPMVWKRLFRIVGNEADASDGFQEVFLTAVKVSRRESICNMAGFLNLTATRCGIDCLRRRQRHPVRSIEGCDAEPACPESDGPMESLLSGELADSLRKGLSGLPAAEAEAFALQVFDELSYRQIADYMQIQENYVGVLINRARAKLRQILNSTAVEYDREVPHGK